MSSAHEEPAAPFSTIRPASAAGSPAPEASPKYLVEEQNRALVGTFGRPRTVLDVGCGIGLNGAAAKRRGAHVTGVEIAPESAERARAVLDEVLSFDITRDDAVAQGLGKRRFDLILFGDVLEHVSDPLAVLRRFVPYLEEEGHVVVSLPNVAAWTIRLQLLRGRFAYTKSGILDDTHLRFFTLDSALALVRDAGLEVLRSEQNPMLVRALNAGAIGYLLKTIGAEELATAVRNAYQHKATFAPEAEAQLVVGVQNPHLCVLTGREREVLSLMARGLNNAQIAEQLTISLWTVKKHVSNIFAKLKTTNRAEVIAFAYQHRLLPDCGRYQ